MGQAFVATADDATTAYWNPAGLSRLENREFSATHAEWFGDINHDFVAYAHPTTIGTFAGSASYLSQPDIEGRGANRQKSGNFGASDIAMMVSFSRPFAGNSSYGLNFKVIEQRIGNETSKGMAVDLGLLGTVGTNLSAAVTLSNIGPGMKFLEEEYRLPLTATAGLGYKLNGHLRAEADIRRRVYEEETHITMGFEYWFGGQVAVRSGYLTSLANTYGPSRRTRHDSGDQLDRLMGFNVGLGLRMFGHQIDYAMTPQGELGGAHRLSISVRF